MEYVFLNNMALIKGINPPKSSLGFEKMSKICDAAEALFDKNGFYGTSITDICKLAKIAVGTFYIYFQDKASIYNYLVRNYYVVIKNYLRKHIQGCKTRYEAEREGIKAFIRFGHEHPQCYKIIWGSSHIDPALFEEYYTQFAQSYILALKKYDAELTDIDCTTAAWCLMGIANFVCLRTIFTHKRLTEKRLDFLTGEVMKLLSNGLFRRPPPGESLPGPPLPEGCQAGVSRRRAGRLVKV
ncbi:MAG: TetR/AcrR family transcriptional regulator [Spirochaetales bacterium]|jgi:AcrR family transcriptional regulator|nr:TetR/AcrR family transcriptional regulator [Spirochaetales bacterium]